MWAGFVAAPVLPLLVAYGFVYLRFGKENFPFLLKEMDTEIVVLDDTLTPQAAAALSKQVEDCLLQHRCPQGEAGRAGLIVEEMGMTILERNKARKGAALIELSLFFEAGSVLLIERDSGELFDLTDPDLHIKGLSSLLLSGLMEARKEKAHLVTTGYNRNMIRFSRS